MENVFVVENVVKAKEQIEQLRIQGYKDEEIYLFHHEKDVTDSATDKLDVSEVGMKEEGVWEKTLNVFRSRGDELRSQFQSLGLSEAEAERYEEELDEHKIVIVAKR